MYQDTPKIIDQVNMSLSSNTIYFDLEVDEFSINFDNEFLAKSSYEVLKKLQKNQFRSLSEELLNNLHPYTVDSLVGILDSQNIVVDQSTSSEIMYSGKALINNIEFFYKKKLLQKIGVDEFTDLICRKKANDHQLARWSTQYHFVTSWAERCIAQAISSNTSNKPLARLLCDFFKEEVGHENLLSKGLDSIDSKCRIVHMSTLAYISRLYKYAMNDIHSFLAFIYILEGSSQDSQRYIDAIQASDLNEDLVSGQVKHEMINISGSHGDEARAIACTISGTLWSDIERAIESVREYYKTRQYMNNYLVNGVYFSHKNIDGFNFLRHCIRTIGLETIHVAIANSKNPTRTKLNKLYLTLDSIEVQMNIADCDRTLYNIIESCFWLLAREEPENYLDIITSVLDNDKSRLSSIQGQITEIITSGLLYASN